jgi:hypothetical protein
MTKKAILIISLSPNDARWAMQQMQAQLEADGSNWKCINEADVVEKYVSERSWNPLCKTAWVRPIKDECAIELFNLTEASFNNTRVSGIIITCSFAIDDNIRKTYCEILTEQGFEVTLKIIETSWMSLMRESYDKGGNLYDVAKMWEVYNQAFVRQYVPDKSFPPAFIVSKDYENTNPAISLMIDTLIQMGVKAITLEDMFSEDDIVKPKHLVKIDTFWRKVANYYHVQLVIETDAVTQHRWRTIGVPVISLENPFALRYNI